MKIMGILNVTPDSFSDGGDYVDLDRACQRAEVLLEQGADIIDIGAESNRLVHEFVSLDQEWSRLEPVLDALSSKGLSAYISIDTNKPEVMKRLPEMGIHIVNDIKIGADSDTLSFLASRSMTYIAMHMHQTPKTMQQSLGCFGCCRSSRVFSRTHERLRGLGFSNEQIWLDPGIGFGKTTKANAQLGKASLGWLEVSDTYGNFTQIFFCSNTWDRRT